MLRYLWANFRYKQYRELEGDPISAFSLAQLRLLFDWQAIEDLRFHFILSRYRGTQIIMEVLSVPEQRASYRREHEISQVLIQNSRLFSATDLAVEVYSLVTELCRYR